MGLAPQYAGEPVEVCGLRLLVPLVGEYVHAEIQYPAFCRVCWIMGHRQVSYSSYREPEADENLPPCGSTAPH